MAKSAEEKAAAQAEKEAAKAAAQAEAPTVPEKKSERQARWDAFLEKHKAQNPEKHAARLEAGELEMPANF